MSTLRNIENWLQKWINGEDLALIPKVAATGMPASVGQKAKAGSLSVTFPSDPDAVPVVGNSDLLDVILSLDTNIYANGDVLAATQEIADAVRIVAGKALPLDIQVIDEDDLGIALDLLFFRSNISIGNENAAFSISDAGSRDLLGSVSIAAEDFTDWGGWREAFIKNSAAAWKMGLWKAAAASTSIFVAAITRGGTPTYSANGIRLKISVVRD